MRAPASARDTYELARGIVALPSGLAWLPTSRTLLAADAHFAYEEIVGATLPLWSTATIASTLERTARAHSASEIVFLGDIIHGPHLSEGAARAVRATLDTLRKSMTVTLVAGNHEGRSRAFAVLGETVEAAERDGWLLIHGDGRASLTQRATIGHLHPSLHLARNKTVRAFVASEHLVVLPALNPYSPGLDILSADFATALGAWNVRTSDAHVVAALNERVYPFGSLANLRESLRAS
jgi:metallophosphoesterase superfamily enzyme